MKEPWIQGSFSLFLYRYCFSMRPKPCFKAVKNNSLTTVSGTQTFKMPAPNKNEKCINL